jgi:hypothetical protein
MNMKINIAFKAFLTFVFAVGLTSCNNSRDYKNNSRATGWDINSDEGGFQYNTDYKEQEAGPGLFL